MAKGVPVLVCVAVEAKGVGVMVEVDVDVLATQLELKATCTPFALLNGVTELSEELETKATT